MLEKELSRFQWVETVLFIHNMLVVFILLSCPIHCLWLTVVCHQPFTLIFWSASWNNENLSIPPHPLNSNLSFPLPLPEVTTLFTLAYAVTIADRCLVFLPRTCPVHLSGLRLWPYPLTQKLSMAPCCLLPSVFSLTFELSRNWL